VFISDLDIFGFKSFAHKSQFKFSKGVTCVVGPNGCGKTNVVDAIRWVMGEQKSSLLRGDKMTDVIFAGSKYKKPLNYAEVSLTIHNDRGILPLAYTEVTLARRLFRDNTSEYLLNNTPVRLKDIQDLFQDTGMSSDVYSVIELKMVEDILNENKDSRKRLFEEAAGIGKYRSQRKSAMRKLDATRDDLKRLEDIIYEIDKKVSALHRQLKRYEKYQEYIDELRDMEILKAQLNYQALSDEIVPLEERLSSKQVQKDESTQQLSIEESMLETYRREEEDLDRHFQELLARIDSLNTGIGESNTRRMVLEEKIRHAGENTERLSREKEEVLQRKKANESIRDEIAGSLDGNDPEIEGLTQRLKDAEAELKQADARHRDISEQGRRLEEDLLGRRGRLQDIEQKILRHSDSLRQLTELKDGLVLRMEEAEAKDRMAEQRILEQKDLIQQLEKEIRSMDRVLQEKEQEKDRLNSLISEGRDALSRLRARNEQNVKELNFYRGILESMEGFNPGVKFVMKDLRHPGILGTVSDLMRVDEDYRQAIEIGLGNAARFLVSDSRDSALDVIDSLKQQQRGRVTIVPLDIAAEKLRTRRDLDYEKSPNFLAYATDVAEAEGSASILVDYFLSDLVIVRSLRELPDHLMKRSSFRFVTPDGDYYEQKGLLRGGKNRDGSRQILGRREKVQQLEALIRTFEKEENILKQQIQGSSMSYSEQLDGIREIRANRDQLEKQFHDKDKMLSNLDYGLQRSQEEKEGAARSLSSYEQRISDTEKSREALTRDLKSAAEDFEKSQGRFRDFQAENEQFLSEKNALSEKVQSIRIDLITREREKETVQFRYNNAVDTIRDLTQRILDINAEFERQQVVVKDSREQFAEVEKTLAEQGARLQALQEERRGQQDTLQALRQKIGDTGKHIQEQHKARENVFQTLKEIEIKLSDIRQQQKQIRERIYERYHFDISVRDFVHSEMTMDEIDEGIDRLRRRIELIGPINMAVKLEYDEESERLRFLQEQQKDLLDAEKSVMDTVTKLDHEARTQFSDIFSRVRENFNRTFTLFFPNGEADIRLVGSPDPLEASIEIYARPKTKDLKTLKALSGGEKALTAISLLFSIYLVKPSPYCILDEVDAPLDDQNIRRFTNALKHFTDRTQFIIVTHNKLTMEAADYLYGVTMEEEGVSKIVSVRFSGSEETTATQSAETD